MPCWLSLVRGCVLVDEVVVDVAPVVVIEVTSPAPSLQRRRHVICDRRAALRHTAHRFYGLSGVYLGRAGM